MSEGPGISAVLPAFEEARRLEDAVRSLSSALTSTAGEDWEILLVTSAAARDGTPEVARTLVAADERVRVVEQAADDPGYGRALALGIAGATRRILFLSDADGQFDFNEVARLYPHTARAEAVLGYRAFRADAAGRRLAGILYATSIRVVLGVSARDTDCAFKLIHARMLRGVRLLSRTGAVNAEILGHVRARSGRVVELPVSHRARSRGHSRFERRVGPVVIPDPSEAAAIAYEIGVLTSRRLLATRGRGTW